MAACSLPCWLQYIIATPENWKEFAAKMTMPVELADLGLKLLEQRITEVGELYKEPLYRATFLSKEDYTFVHAPARTEAATAQGKYYYESYPAFQEEYGGWRPAVIEPGVAFGGAIIPQGEQGMSAGCFQPCLL